MSATDLTVSVPMSKKRKLDIIDTSAVYKAKATYTGNNHAITGGSPVVAPSSYPVTFVQNLFASTSYGQKVLARQALRSNSTTTTTGTNFQKPSRAEIDAYDLAVVQGVRDGNVDLLRSLHASGVTMNAANRFGESLIALACRRGNLDVVRFFIREARVRLDTVCDDYGRTPLHDACWTPVPNFCIMEELLQACSPELLLVRDIRGHTPFHYARKDHWNDWVAFLQSHSATLLHKLAEEATNDETVISTAAVDVTSVTISSANTSFTSTDPLLVEPKGCPGRTRPITISG